MLVKLIDEYCLFPVFLWSSFGLHSVVIKIIFNHFPELWPIGIGGAVVRCFVLLARKVSPLITYNHRINCISAATTCSVYCGIQSTYQSQSYLFFTVHLNIHTHTHTHCHNMHNDNRCKDTPQ